MAKIKSKRRTVQEELMELESMNEYQKKQKEVNLNFPLKCEFKTEKQKLLYETIEKNRITFVNGPGGTGKTILALYAGLKLIKNPKINLDHIVLTKPIVEITTSKGLGALPGDITEKTLSYFSHFYDNLIKLIGNENTKYLKNNGIIKETILNFLRGSTFGTYDADGKPIGTFCIFDEAQNSSIMEMKTFISRMGEESKLVIMGDADQVDLKLPKGEKTGLQDAMCRLRGIDKIGFIEFTEDEIVRDPFLIEIMKRYKIN